MFNNTKFVRDHSFAFRDFLDIRYLNTREGKSASDLAHCKYAALALVFMAVGWVNETVIFFPQNWQKRLSGIKQFF